MNCGQKIQRPVPSNIEGRSLFWFCSLSAERFLLNTARYRTSNIKYRAAKSYFLRYADTILSRLSAAAAHAVLYRPSAHLAGWTPARLAHISRPLFSYICHFGNHIIVPDKHICLLQLSSRYNDRGVIELKFHYVKFWFRIDFLRLYNITHTAVSYTHLTLPTN